MKIIIFLLLFMVSSISKAATYYVSPTGNDANDGSYLTAFASIGKLNTVMSAGDIAYIRGGTYYSTKGNSDTIHFEIKNLIGTLSSPVIIQSYPGELPIFDLATIVPSFDNPFAMAMTGCKHVHLKGRMIIKNLKQVIGGAGTSRGFDLSDSDNCRIEFLDIFNMGGSGFIIENDSKDNYILNCDSHHNGDGLSIENPDDPPGTDAWDNADGFGCTSNFSLPANTSTRNIFDGCRAWLNSDDGWDFFGTNGIVTLKNCWSFWNGVKPWGPDSTQVSPSTMTTNNYAAWHNNVNYSASSGEGFKLGSARTQALTSITKIIQNCISFENRGCGYSSNSDDALTTKHQYYNNIAYKNDNDGFGYADGHNPGWSTGTEHIFKNNWSYANNIVFPGGDWAYDGSNSSGIANNYWATVYNNVSYGNLSTITLNNADFLSVSSTGVDTARQTDGTIEGVLPYLPFLRLVTNSDLADAGKSVSLPFKGNAPDIGAFEYDTGSIVNLKLYLQGYCKEDNGLMQPVLVKQNVGASTTETDTINVELHNSFSPYSTVAVSKAVLHTNGTASVKFPAALSGKYYIAIQHRNTILTWSATPITVGATTVVYDFTTAANKAYGNNMIQVGSVWAMYTGDVDQDGYIDPFDFTEFYIDSQNGVNGVYAATDFNGDGHVDPFDSIFDDNIRNGIYSVHP